MVSELEFIQNGEKLNIENLPDGAFILFTSGVESEFTKSQLQGFEEKFEDFKKQNVSIFFLSDNKDGKTDSKVFLRDVNQEVQTLVPDLADKNDIGENLIIFTKKGDELHFSELKKLPENEYDWSETMDTWVHNFNDPDLGDDGMWRWGQVCQKTADYLCVDCGYVEEIVKGKTFPICIVCLSGEVDGPSGPAEEYWEEL